MIRNLTRNPWARIRSKAARTAFGDIDISGYFAAGRDINVEHLTVTEASPGKANARIRKKMLRKVLPSWVNEGEYWQDGDAVEFPVKSEFGIAYVSRRRPDIEPVDRRSAVKVWDEVDVVQALDASAGKLLVLGGSGSGKTRSLRQIMRVAIDRALHDDENPMPFYFHLSDWSDAGKDMKVWLARSIRENYGILPRMFAQWLASSEVMIILDGLDELKLRERRDCISAVNRFISDNPAVQLVAACRLNEYRDTGKKLNLKASLLLEGVDESRLPGIIRDAGDSLTGLGEALIRDRKLRDLLRNPLFLRLAISLYSEGGDVDITSSVDRRKSLLAAYVDYAERRMASSGVKPDRWLYFMARGLKSQRRVTFCPDRYPVEFLPIWLKELAEKRTLVTASLFVIVPSILLRGVMTLLAPNSSAKPIYLIITVVAPVAYGILAWHLVKDDLWAPLAGRKASVVRGLLRFAKRIVLVCLVEGIAAWSLVATGAADGSLGGISLVVLVALSSWPAIKMARESEASDPSEIPDRVGGEIFNLLRVTVVVTSLVSGAMYVTLTVIFEALDSARVVGEGLLYSPMLNSFFFVLPIAFIAALKNGGVDLIRRDQCRRIMIRFGYLPKGYRVALEEIRKSSLVIPRRGALEFKHTLIRDHLSERFHEDVAPLSFVSIRSE
ncbi:NACHT domain-containing protein [Streptomyces buecherae]|uniref:NACHT domain-containing protein n=1 Tax=Streptomyces buecherae TaxID=2763006 RepID=UPI0037993BB5